MHFELLDELVIIFLLSIVVNLVCNKIKLTATVGFLLTGVLCGPSLLGIVDSQSISDVAELGVAMLLFTIGMELSGEALSRLKRPVFLGGSLQIGLTVLAIAGLTALLDGTSLPSGIFWGLSRGPVLFGHRLANLPAERPHQHADGASFSGHPCFSGHHGRAHDALCAPAVRAVPYGAPGHAAVGAEGGRHPRGPCCWPRIWASTASWKRVMRTRSRELLFLSTLGTCFGMALLTHSLGLSLSLGAFLAGLMLARSQYSMSVISGHHALP